MSRDPSSHLLTSCELQGLPHLPTTTLHSDLKPTALIYKLPVFEIEDKPELPVFVEVKEHLPDLEAKELALLSKMADDLIEEIPSTDPVLGSVRDKHADPATRQLNQKRSVYFEDVFAVREPYNTPAQSVHKGSVVTIEVRMNNEIRPDNVEEVMAILSARFSQIFQRGENSVLIDMHHGACIYFGTASASAYLITISGVASLFGPRMTEHYTTVIQTEMRELFGIPEKQGVLRFVPIEDKDLATKGLTMKAAITNMQEAAKLEHSSIVKALTRSVSKKLKTKRSNSASVTLPTVSEAEGQTTTEGAAGDAKKTEKKESLLAKYAKTLREFFDHA